MISGAQIKAARTLLGWTQRDLCDAVQKAAVKISLETVKRMETGGIASIATGTYFAVLQVLKDQGIEFVDEKGVILNRQKGR